MFANTSLIPKKVICFSNFRNKAHYEEFEKNELVKLGEEGSKRLPVNLPLFLTTSDF